jgi:anaerobic ribonucleoside-triphosphate reductase
MKRTKTERYTRVVGYIRPIAQMNEGKQEEVNDRQMFCVEE